jgi:hypothetical protein
MSDFESRVRDALGAGASGAPEAVGLAAAARGRARARRRTTVAVAAVAVLALVAVPAGVLALRDSGHSGPGVAKDPTDSPSSVVPDGWRTETWHDLEVQVPDDWGYGALSTWCISADQPGDPVVQRPEGAVEMIACIPASGYGISFFDSAVVTKLGPEGKAREPGDASLPEGAWTGFATVDGGAGVAVVAATEELAQQVLDSAVRVDGVDGNGCAPKTAKAPGVGDEDAVSVCRYDAAGLLVQSERLTGRDASDAVAALEAAPADERWHDVPCPPDSEAGFVRMLTGAGAYDVYFEGTCEDRHGVVGPGGNSYLTMDVLYWAISAGWSGGVSADVPLPSELRR